MASSKVKIAAQKTRKMYVKIGKELCTLEKEDIDYILNIAKTESDICRRMTTARKRQGTMLFSQPLSKTYQMNERTSPFTTMVSPSPFSHVFISKMR